MKDIGSVAEIKKQGKEYGSLNQDGKKPLEGRKVMVEYSSPNTFSILTLSSPSRYIVITPLREYTL